MPCRNNSEGMYAHFTAPGTGGLRTRRRRVVKNWWTSVRTTDRVRTQRWAVGAFGALLIVCSVVAWTLIPEKHVVTVKGLGEPVVFTTTQQELGAALTAQGITLSAKDQIDIAPDTSLKGRKVLTVTVRKAVSVSLAVDGNVITTETTAPTVDDLLKELGVTLGPKDSINTDMARPLTAGLALEITRRHETTEVVREEIPYELVRQEDRRIMVGDTRELQAGEPGIREVKKVIYYENGVAVGEDILEEVVLAEPVDQIVAYGTGGVVSRGGRDYRFVQEMVLSATGYTAGKESNPNGNGYTYTGMKAERGVVAVDPTVIPLYTRVYVEGYGPAIAADIGGAIKGDKIDLCFDTVQEALDWGRRPVTVYILAD